MSSGTDHILHILSNRKWTERSEPATDLAAAQRRAGAQVTFACGRWTEPQGRESSVEVQAAGKGLAPVVLHLDKHLHVPHALADIPRLRELMRQNAIEVVHAHMDNAHLLGHLARRPLSPRPALVLSSYEVEGTPAGVRTRYLLRRTQGVVVISERARQAMMARYELEPERVAVIEPGIDLDRFSPDRGVADLRGELGLGSSDVVLGVVSRLRHDRRIDLAVHAMKLLSAQRPDLKLMIVGHGEDEQLLRALAADLGIASRIKWAGYCRGDRLVSAYRTMNLLVYPVPGTDPSCRTVREALAAGVPVIAGRGGFLSELVEEGVSGHFMDLAAESLAAVARELPVEKLAALSATGLAAARRRFDLALQARRCLAFYRQLQPPSR